MVAPVRYPVVWGCLATPQLAVDHQAMRTALAATLAMGALKAGLHKALAAVADAKLPPAAVQPA